MRLTVMDIKKEFEIIKRNTEEIVPEEELIEKLKKSRERKRPLKIKCGADPTSPDIHLGHTVVLKKLQEFQRLGHEILFLIGDFTARIGDPSGRDSARPPLSPEKIEKNARTYAQQVFKILDEEKTTVVYNSRWLKGMNLEDFMRLLSLHSVSRTLERNEFRERIKKGRDIRMLEFIYPLLQGYDSVVLEADVEIGASEQKFNLLMGRILQKRYGQEPQIVITMPVLEGLDGKQKMSKSLGNYVGISESPDEIYGKLMSIPDELIVRYFSLLTTLEDEEVKKIETSLREGRVNPKILKENLALRIVEEFYDEKDAEEAKRRFDAKHTPKKSLQERLVHLKPEKRRVSTSQLKNGKIWICRLLTTIGATSSNSEARRLLQQGAVHIEEEKITDSNIELALSKDTKTLVRVGKRKYYEVTVE